MITIFSKEKNKDFKTQENRELSVAFISVLVKSTLQ